VFGSECWEHIPNKTRNKLEPKSHKFIFVGYSVDYKSYMLFDPSKQDVIILRDVQFNEVSPYICKEKLRKKKKERNNGRILINHYE
jgi:hypothetical protein